MRCEYASLKFPDWKVRSIVKTFRHILREIASVPETQLNQIELINDRDLQNYVDWNQNMTPPVNRCVHEIIQEHVHANPLNQAVDAWDGQYAFPSQS